MWSEKPFDKDEIRALSDKNVLGGFIAEAEHLRIKASLKDRLNALQF